ncbi:MAG: 5-formyltetrahydrofolate cyclo-ligase [Pikeienuella sp.]
MTAELAALTAEKAALRKQIFARRRAPHAEKADRDPRANNALLAAVGSASGAIVAGYRPIRTEIDPTDAMTDLHNAGARICVPVIEALHHPLKFREWTPDCEMIEGAFGAAVPATGEYLDPNIVIAPLVGWDRQGWRLGYGGGFYDRSLEGLRAKQPTRAIGFAYAAQELPEAPQEPTDQQLDAIVTEDETILIDRGVGSKFNRQDK